MLYLHTAEIIHRDLKPSNVLINSECLVKIADFGLARSVLPYDDATAPIMTEYVATRWYRAPEIVLGSSQYSKAVDMWSVGCILGELIVGKAIFPGKSTINQIELILDLLGKPKPEDLEDIGGVNDWNIINSINARQKYTFSTYFKGASKHAIDFLKKCLEFNPKKRISVEEALKHPFVEQFHSPKDEKRSNKIIEIPISDQKKLTIREYREALYADILKKKKEQRKKWQMAYLKQLGINVADEHGQGGPQEIAYSPINEASRGVNNPERSIAASQTRPKDDVPQKKESATTTKTTTGVKSSSKIDDSPSPQESLQSKYSKPVTKPSSGANPAGPSKPGATGSSNMQYVDYMNGLFKNRS